MQTILQKQFNEIFERYFNHPEDMGTLLPKINQLIETTFSKIHDPEKIFNNDLGFEFSQRQLEFYQKNQYFLTPPDQLAFYGDGFFDLIKLEKKSFLSLIEANKKSSFKNSSKKIPKPLSLEPIFVHPYSNSPFLTKDENLILNSTLGSSLKQMDNIYNYLFSNYQKEFRVVKELNTKNKDTLAAILTNNSQALQAGDILANLAVLNAFFRSKNFEQYNAYTYRNRNEVKLGYGMGFLFLHYLYQKNSSQYQDLYELGHYNAEAPNLISNYAKLRQNKHLKEHLRYKSINDVFENIKKTYTDLQQFELKLVKDILEEAAFPKLNTKSMSLYEIKEELLTSYYKKNNQPIMDNFSFAIAYNLWQNSFCKDKKTSSEIEPIELIFSKEKIWREVAQLKELNENEKRNKINPL